MKLGIIIGSVRESRVSQHIAEAIAKRAEARDGVEVSMLDLKTYNLPVFNEAISPKYNPDRKPEGAAKEWLDALAGVDALVIVSPEYNRSVSGALKNALDYIAYEVSHKPVALASHGSYSGAYALTNLRTIVPELGGVTIPLFISLPYGQFDAEGNFSGDQQEFDSHTDNVLEELHKYSDALEVVRKNSN